MKMKLSEQFVDASGVMAPKYEPVGLNELRQGHSIIKDIVSEGEQCGYISTPDAALMVPVEPRPGRLYGLVKDHKPVVPGTGIPPLREVVSGSGSNTEYISAFVDHHLKQEVRKLPSFVEDTPDFLRCIEERNSKGPLPDHVFPVSMDVCALYPSIPWKEGLEALERAAERREDKGVPTNFILRLMVLVLGAKILYVDTRPNSQKLFPRI